MAWESSNQPVDHKLQGSRSRSGPAVNESIKCTLNMCRGSQEKISKYYCSALSLCSNLYLEIHSNHCIKAIKNAKLFEISQPINIQCYFNKHKVLCQKPPVHSTEKHKTNPNAYKMQCIRQVLTLTHQNSIYSELQCIQLQSIRQFKG